MVVNVLTAVFRFDSHILPSLGDEMIHADKDEPVLL